MDAAFGRETVLPTCSVSDCLVTDPVAECEFLQQYREGAIRGALFAALAAASVYLAFLAIARLTEPHSPEALFLRAGLIATLLLAAFICYRFPGFALRHYLMLTGTGSLIALGGVVALLSFGPHGSASLESGASPALVFGLFLHYSFLRLPLWAAAGVGWLVSGAYLLWAGPMVVGGNAEVRTLVYLAFSNVAGMIVCRSFEMRERELFHQRRRAELAQHESLQRAKAAEEAHAEKSRLLAAVSHDLRQPIMAASTYVSLINAKLQKGDPVAAQRQLAHLGDAIGMLGATLDHLLTAARYDSGNEPIRIEAVELGPLLEQLSRTFEDDAREKGLELRVRMPSQRIVVTSDATALWRVLMNLVSNAIKFTDAEGRQGRGVVVRARVRNGVCRIDVADNGIGIAPEHLQSIWQPYYQVQNAERNRARGLGLGLFLVRRALDHLEGHELRLRSRPGRGSRFTLLLPGSSLSDPRVVLRAPEPLEEDSLRALQGAYVLVLEDDRDARRAIQELLDDWGVVHVGAATLEELLPEALSAGRPPDALITDFRLPGQLSGAACVHELRLALGESFPAIIVTGESDLASVREVMPADATLLPKPFEMPALARPLLMAVERARRAESL